MLPQHLVCKYELNCEYCNITLARNKAPRWWSDKIETCRSVLKCFMWNYMCIRWLINWSEQHVLVWRTVFKLCICTGLKWKHTHSLLFYCDTVLHCHRWSPLLVCSLPQYPHQNFSALLLPLPEFSSLDTPAWWQITICPFWPGHMMCHTVTLCFSAHVGNNLAAVIITHLPRSWESSASIAAKLWPMTSKLQGLIPGRDIRIVPSPNCPQQLWSPANLPVNGCPGICLHQAKWLGHDAGA